MARIIPNQNTWVGWTTTAPASLSAPTTAEIAACVDFTPFVISMTANSTGNTVPTPTIDSLFETSVPGTTTASFTADFYRDDTADTAWTTLIRATKGYFIISRFGGTGSNQAPAAGQIVEVWPVTITSRSAGPMSSNTVQTFTVNAAVPVEPVENATVTSASSVPTSPLNIAASLAAGVSGATATVGIGAATVLTLDWDVPAYLGTPASPYYKVYKSSTTSFASTTEITSGIVKSGTTAVITTSSNAANFTTAGTWYVKVSAINSNGEGPLSTNYITVTVTA